MNPSESSEGFQPRAHWSPTTPARRLLFYCRLLADLQTNTIYRDLRKEFRRFSGKILDVGCGNSPFRHIFDPIRTEYIGIDVHKAKSFGYQNPDTIYYEGRDIPFPDASFDAIVCTEVLEHIVDPTEIIRELHRVLKPDGFGVITIPWSARFHYQPHDYHRYTPSMLKLLFSSFRDCGISARGTDLSSVGSKVVVSYIRNFLRMRPSNIRDCLWIPLRVLFAAGLIPLLLAALVAAHLGILFGLGSKDDPLGYTILIRK